MIVGITRIRAPGATNLRVAANFIRGTGSVRRRGAPAMSG
nr:MAG TPA: hypothetical protein [Caudoviricetes sp.]